MRNVKKCIALLSMTALIPVFTGCSEVAESWKPVGSENAVGIAVVGDDEFYTDGGTVEAIELAADDFYNEHGVRINVTYYDDDADYHKAIAFANEIAADPDIAAVIVKEEIGFIETVADIYEAAKKPFIITNGCYSEVIDKGYDYLLVDFINAKAAGSTMGQYIKDNGFKRAVFCHSDTKYEEDELKGFQSQISDSDAALVDTVVGPYTQEEFDIAYSRWQLLDVDVLCVSDYFSLNSNIVKMLRQKGSDIQVVSDYVMDTDNDIELNGRCLEGTVIVPLYGAGNSAADVSQRYEERYGLEMLERAIQSYDLIYILGSGLTSGISDPKDFMDHMKSPDGHKGLYGLVYYDERGALIPSGNDILVFSDGGFRSIDQWR